MEWFAFAIVVLGTIYFAIRHRGFRRGLLFTVLGLVVLAAVASVVDYFLHLKDERQRQIARTLIKPNQLEITGATLSIGTVSEIKAMVANKSPHYLAELGLKVTVVDCPANVLDQFDRPPPTGVEPAKKGDLRWAQLVGKCPVVGEYVAREYGLNIPSGQKRAFRDYVSFPNLPPLKPNEWSWYFTIVETVASRD